MTFRLRLVTNYLHLNKVADKSRHISTFLSKSTNRVITVAARSTGILGSTAIQHYLRSFSTVAVISKPAGFGSSNMHSEKSIVDFPNCRIITVPATADNFMYLIVDKSTLQAAIVDPVEPETVLDVIRKENVTLTTILTTHHHWDHAGGNEKLVELHKKEISDSKLEVYGGDDRIGALTKKIGQGDKLTVGSLNIECLFTPCHTTGHICYYLQTEDTNIQKPAVFTGDTLFIAGCGRFFEGSPQQMFTALIEKLGELPAETLVFCGHEYTVNNLKFCLSVEPNNQAARDKMTWAENQRAKKIPTVPSSIEEEKNTNPFMRVGLSHMQSAVGASDAISCMRALRSMKDNFKA